MTMDEEIKQEVEVEQKTEVDEQKIIDRSEEHTSELQSH